MTTTLGAEWWVTCDMSAVGAENRDDAVLVLRLGLAMNALRSQMRFIRFTIEREPDVARWRDLNATLLQAAAYTKEAVGIMSGSSGRGDRHVPGASPRVHQMADRWPRALELEPLMRQLEAGTHPACAVINRVRNQLAFHWDPSVLSDWLETRKEERLHWVESAGARTHEVTHRAAADALALAIRDGRDESSFQEMIQTVIDAMKLVIEYFELAVFAYLERHGSRFEGEIPVGALAGGAALPTRANT